jgi:transcriptional regulator with XRE-family HTH domain
MNTQKAVSMRILELCSKQNISINGLATISAVPPSTLKNIISGVSKNPGIVTIKKLCDGLNIPLIEFFDTDVFRSLEQEIK